MNTEGKEVWAENEIPFEVAERIVKARMVEVVNDIKAKGGDPFISINHLSYGRGVLEPHGTGATIAEAIANMPTAEDAKAKRIAELKVELAKLEPDADKGAILTQLEKREDELRAAGDESAAKFTAARMLIEGLLIL